VINNCAKVDPQGLLQLFGEFGRRVSYAGGARNNRKSRAVFPGRHQKMEYPPKQLLAAVPLCATE